LTVIYAVNVHVVRKWATRWWFAALPYPAAVRHRIAHPARGQESKIRG
jgi:hypothetical protein